MVGGIQPPCPACIRASELRQHQGKRQLSVGRLLPDIVYYNDPRPPASYIDEARSFDICGPCDLLVVAGTGLKVPGITQMVREFSQALHNQKGKGFQTIFVNKSSPMVDISKHFDVWVEGDIQHFAQYVIHGLESTVAMQI